MTTPSELMSRSLARLVGGGDKASPGEIEQRLDAIVAGGTGVWMFGALPGGFSVGDEVGIAQTAYGDELDEPLRSARFSVMGRAAGAVPLLILDVAEYNARHAYILEQRDAMPYFAAVQDNRRCPFPLFHAWRAMDLELTTPTIMRRVKWAKALDATASLASTAWPENDLVRKVVLASELVKAALRDALGLALEEAS